MNNRPGWPLPKPEAQRQREYRAFLEDRAVEAAARRGICLRRANVEELPEVALKVMRGRPQTEFGDKLLKAVLQK